MKHYIPERTCIVTREKHPQNALFRIAKVKFNDGYKIVADPNHSLGGRGVYLLPDKEILDIVLKKQKLRYMLKLDRALTDEEIENIRNAFQKYIDSVK